MTRAKIAVSLPAQQVAAVKRMVQEGKAASVSGYVEKALAAHLEDDDLNAWLERRLLASGGPMTDEERAWADAALGH